MKKLIALFLVAVMGLSCVAALAEFDASKEIVVVSREEGSGTRGAFVELTKVEEKNDKGEKIDRTSEEALIQKGTSEVLTTVAGNVYAIGYISLSSLNDTVKALKINGVEATTENILANTYPIARPFNIVTKAEGLSDLANDFIKFVMSKDGQEVVKGNKAIAVAENAEAYASAKLEGKLVIGGSSSVSPVMEKLIEAYKAVNTKVEIELQTTDSTTGVTNSLSGAYDIGMASRGLKDSEVEKGAKATVIAMDGIAVVVNPGNATEDMSLEQLKSIFVGELNTWAELSK